MINQTASLLPVLSRPPYHHSTNDQRWVDLNFLSKCLEIISDLVHAASIKSFLNINFGTINDMKDRYSVIAMIFTSFVVAARGRHLCILALNEVSIVAATTILVLHVVMVGLNMRTNAFCSIFQNQSFQHTHDAC